MSEELLVYSIQQTYILTHVLTPEREIVTCNQRIDIPTIEPLTNVQPVFSAKALLTIIPCIELVGKFLSEFDLTFETNEGVTVLPVMLDVRVNPATNPHMQPRYVLVLPRGATGVKSCKLIHKATGKEVQHNFTFGIMPPPYNYDNALFGGISYTVAEVASAFSSLQHTISSLKLATQTPTFTPKLLPKGAGKQTINIENGVLFFETEFRYNLSAETTIHKPKITLRGDGIDQVYTLSLDRAVNNVLIDLFTRTLTAYDKVTHEIIQQLKLTLTSTGYEKLSFENFDDVDASGLPVLPMGARVI